MNGGPCLKPELIDKLLYRAGFTKEVFVMASDSESPNSREAKSTELSTSTDSGKESKDSNLAFLQQEVRQALKELEELDKADRSSQ